MDITKDFTNKISNIYNEMESLKKDLTKKISTYDLMLSDIMHIIENDNFSASEGYNLAKKIKEIRNERRKIKNEYDKINSLVDNTQLFKRNIDKRIERIIKEQAKRTYTMRIFTESDVAFKSDKIVIKK